MNTDELINKYLSEMATICAKTDGFGLIIRVYSGEGKVPHVHIFDTNNKKMGVCVLTKHIPVNQNDFVALPGHNLVADSMKKSLLKWANSINDLGVSNWKYAQKIYQDLNR